MSGSDMRATPPSRRMSAGTRSSAITAQAPASSAIFACSASTTSMITPPLSISARPLLTRIVPISCMPVMLAPARSTAATARSATCVSSSRGSRVVSRCSARPGQQERAARSGCDERCTSRQSSIVSASDEHEHDERRPERRRQRQHAIGQEGDGQRERREVRAAARREPRRLGDAGPASRRAGAPRPRRSPGARRRAGGARGRAGP